MPADEGESLLARRPMRVRPTGNVCLRRAFFLDLPGCFIDACLTLTSLFGSVVTSSVGQSIEWNRDAQCVKLVERCTNLLFKPFITVVAWILRAFGVIGVIEVEVYRQVAENLGRSALFLFFLILGYQSL